jgi:hypothetical protein
MDLTMDAEDAELVVETAAAPAATTVDQVNVPDSEILDCELTVTSPAAVNNTPEGLVPQTQAGCHYAAVHGNSRYWCRQRVYHCSARLSKRKGTLGKAGTTNPTRLGEHLDSCLACPEPRGYKETKVGNFCKGS